MDGLRARTVVACASAWLAIGCTTTGGLREVTGPGRLPERVELTSTPFFAQTEHECGPAALATLLGASQRAVAPEQLASEVYVPGRAGSLQPELLAAIRARGLVPYVLRPDLSEVMAEVAAGRPVLVLQRLGFGPWPSWHYAVVIGYDAGTGRMLLRSGTEPRAEPRAAPFDVTWRRAGQWAVVALEPGTLPARPEPGRYMQAAASLEANGRFADARLAYAAAAERWPDEALPRLGLGNVAAAEARWADAEREYRRVLELDPAQAAALNNRAHALVQLGCTGTALVTLEQGAADIAADDPLRPALDRTRQQAERRAAQQADGPTGCAPLGLAPTGRAAR